MNCTYFRMQNLKQSSRSLVATFYLILTILVLSMSTNANANTAIKREILESKRASSKILSRLRQVARHNKGFLHEEETQEAYHFYWNIHSKIKNLHKRALKKGELGKDDDGNYSDELAYKELDDFIQYVGKYIITFSELEGYKRLPSSRKLLVSQIANSVETLIQYLKEDGYNISIPADILDGLKKLSKIYKKQEEFLALKEELLGDYFEALDLLEEELYKLEDNLKQFIKRAIGPRRERRHRIYTDESYPYLKFKRLADSIADDLEDFDINDLDEYEEISKQVLDLQHLVKLTKANNKNTKVLLNRVNILFNRFSLEAAKVNSKLRPTKIETDLGIKSVEYKYYRATQVCSLLGGPGNILLRKSIESDIDLFEDFSPRTSGAIKLVEFLKFNDRQLDFRHAEIITDIERDTRITSMGFYPLSFNWGKDEEDKMPPFLEIKKGYRRCDSSGCDTYNDYRTNFAWMSVNASSAKKVTKRKEKALKKVDKKEKYSKLGVCSDFVNWAFGNVISSNWNQIPIIRNLIQIVYPPEGLQTPDNLYESYMTDVVCEVEKRKLKYPQYVNAHNLKEQILRDMNSSNEAISVHAKNSLNELVKKGIIDKDLNLKYDVIEFEIK